MKALLTIGICGGLLAGVVWLYKRWERSQQEQEPTDENDNYFIN